MLSAGETVTAFIHAIEANDLQRALTMVADDVEYDNVPMRKVHGPDGVRGVLEPFLASCSAIEWVVKHQVVAPGDGPGDGTVMNERVDRFEIDGRWVEIPLAGLFVVSGGQIVLWRDYFDDAMFRSQLAG